MQNKKIYTTLIITLLTISLIMAALPLAIAEITTPPALYVPASTPVTPLTTGPVGTKVMVVGATGAGDASPFSTVSVYWDSLGGQVLGTVSADVNGEYMINVTIPSGATGVHYVVVNDGETESEGAAFTVTASVRASVSPPTGPIVRALPGDEVTLTCHGFAADDDLTVTLTGPAGTLAIPTTVPTNSSGSGTAVIVVPAIDPADYGTYTVTCEDGAATTATATIVVDYYITVFPPAGPSGVTIIMSGRIPANMPYELRMDTTVIATGTSGTDGTFSNPYTLPPLIGLGGHTIYVYWQTTNFRSVPFTVNPPPVLTLISPASGVAGATITISGAGFSALANITLTLGATVVNSTATDDRFGPTDIFGAFTALEFTVPAIAPGVYVLTVADQFGATTGSVYTFTVLPTPATTVALNGATYYPGDKMSWTFTSTDTLTALPVCTVRDPSGATWWSETWPITVSGPITRVEYEDQQFVSEPPMLPADCPLGSWNWTITYEVISTPGTKTATGLFDVIPLPGQQDVLDAIAEMKAQVEAHITSVETTSKNEIIARINTVRGEIIADLADLDPKIQGIEDGVVVIATMLGEVQVAIDALDLGTMGADITAIRGDVATVRTSLGTVSTNVGNLDAKVTALTGNVATVSTTVGTIQGTVTSIDGTVATIETAVGTLQADLNSAQADLASVSADVDAALPVDMIAVWIAVILAAIAAGAAVFAVITIRQKIAG